MSTSRIAPQIGTQLNPFGAQSATGQAAEAAPIGQQIQQVLFGRPKPVVLDPSQHPALAQVLLLLRRYKKKLTSLIGDDDEEYELLLAEGEGAMIDEAGNIYLGAGLLAAHENHPDVLVGVMAHEIGHRPKRWSAYKKRQTLTPEEIDTICRFEETRADIFAGKGLAAVGLDCEPLAVYLESGSHEPHPQYFDPKTRGEVIRDAHAGRTYRTHHERKLFPEFYRMKSVKGHLGEF